MRRQTLKVLGVQRAEDFDVNEPLRDLGLDSLMAVELRNLLGTALKRTLPATVTFDYPSVEALVQFLSVEVFAEELDDDAREPPMALEMPKGILDLMTEDELAFRLAGRLEGLGNRWNS